MKDKSSIFTRRLARLGLVAGIGFCYLVVLILIMYTNYCASCAGSQLWKYTSLGSSLVWVSFFYIVLGCKRRTMSHERRSVLSWNILTLLLFTSVAVLAAPLSIDLVWGEAYRIVYFGWIGFDFFGAMILLVTAIAGIISLSLGLLFQGVHAIDRESALWEGKHWWVPSVRRFSLLSWIVLLPTNFGDANNYVKFSTLFMSALVVPAVYPLVGRVPKLRGFLSTYLGLGAVTLLSIWNLLTTYSLVHPFLVMGFLSFLTVCLSSAVGDMGSQCLDLKRIGNRKALLRISVISCIVLLLVAITWFYSHLTVFV